MPGFAPTVAALAVGWIALAGAIAFVYRRTLSRIVREPVLRHPILIVESDDWGAGPSEQAEALRAIAAVLGRHRDGLGRAPVMSLALVLAVPDGSRIRAEGAYSALPLDDERFAPVRAALRAGVEQGVFALQLHGMEHYWPPALMASADPAVRDWLLADSPALTEALPSHLQSRWVDASRLPSSPLPEAEARGAAVAECRAFSRILGQPAKVVVPPTFVWTRETEAAWAAAGVEFVVTPGWRHPARDERGLPSGDEGPIAGGDRAGMITYLVRSDYFEPARGRDARHALAVLDRCAAEGRPCLLENHRDNFIGRVQACGHALDELDALYRQALVGHSSLRFMSSWELACILRDRDPRWVVPGLRERLPALWQRLQATGRLWKLARMLGFGWLGATAVNALACRPSPR
uniref:Glycosyl hydrolase n=1 Tax=Rubrivivax gelatinosus S1 TaxID=1138313 RepID=L8BAH1_RUBGE|nr:conserved exported hypothetical protein [Rubrivivax gelatinosus S1]